GDLARAIATPRAGMTAQPVVSRRLGVRPASPPARVIAIGISVAAVTAGAVATLLATGTPSAPRPATARAGTAAATPGELRNAILTAFHGVGGDVFYAKITEIYPGKAARWNGVQQDWSYPIRPRAGQQVHIRSVVVPSNPTDKSDTE